MGLNIYFKKPNTDELSHIAGITHNLGQMAKVCELYKPLWRPEEIGITYAKELIPYLSNGLSELVSKPNEYKQFNSPNGWGTYQNLVKFTTEVYLACLDNPDVLIIADR